MLPKLQNSSLAQTLKRENLAFQVQCNSFISSQVKTSSRASSEETTTKTTNPGKIITPLKTPTAPSVTSLNNTSPKTGLPNKNTSQDTSSPCQAPSPNTKGQEEMEENAPPPYKKRKPSKSQSPNQEPSKKDKSPHPNSGDITIEVTFQSEWTTKAPT